VRELGGLLFAYFGPQPAPQLPRWDLLVRDDLDVAVEVHLLPCNWLQCMDNAADPVHFEFLHAAFGNYTLERLGKPAGMTQAKHLQIAFDVFRFGIMKRRLLEGESEDCDDWRVGHPLIFPNLLAVGAEGRSTFMYRVPVDDTRTFQIAYRTRKRAPDAAPLPITVRYGELFNLDGKLVADTIPKQDMIGWVGQGPISDRTREHLTASDKGIIVYHKLLFDNLEGVERGEDPMGIIRDPAENEPMLDIERERKNLTPFQNKYGSYFEKIRDIADLRA
jgi:5,5'-dehydrodivanillate O-demethylase